MKRLILKVKNKNQIEKLQSFSEILYVSKLLNVVGIEIDDKLVKKLEEDENVISWTESEHGRFQLNQASYC